MIKLFVLAEKPFDAIWFFVKAIYAKLSIKTSAIHVNS
jgi:hypothetical protein